MSFAALFTDLYELTMLQAYLEEGLEQTATFSLFVRKLPVERNFLLACGLEPCLSYLEELEFDAAQLSYLEKLGRFSPRLLKWLEKFRFTGDVYAVAEGTPLFAHEPILEVVAPLPQAQLVETFLINQVHLGTVLASKAVRVVLAAAGRQVVDFGARRMHGLDAALKGARAFHIAGVDATSNVQAGAAYGLSVAGTMAHSYVQAHDRELDALRAFARSFPGTTLLVDTYDTLEGVRNVVRLQRELKERFQVGAVRLDSGDLLELSRGSRRILDEAGLSKVRIFASGGLDERKVSALVRSGAPIDGFGVGTAMGVSEDAPSLDLAYKLVSFAGRSRTKLSTGKELWPGRKQIFRQPDGDLLALHQEQLPGRPLLQKVMSGGRRTQLGLRTLDEDRAHARMELERLPARLRSLEASTPHEVAPTPALVAERDRVRAELLG